MSRKQKMLPLLFLSLGLGVSNIGVAASLKDVVQKTVETNPEVLTDSADRLAREQELRQAKAGYYPTLDLTAGYGREGSKNSSTGQSWKWLNRREMALNGRQMLFDGFATKSEVARQTARVNSQAHRVLSSAESISGRAVEVYLEVLRQQGLLEFAQQSLATHQRIYDQIKLRSESGVGKKADLAQIEARLALARINVVTEETNVEDAKTNFLRVVGELPDDLSVPASIKGQLPKTVEEAVQIALDNNAVLKVANADVEAAKAQKKAAESKYYPRFDFEVGRRWDDDLDGVEGENEEIQAMIRMRYNLFNGGADKARVKETAHLINQAKEIRNNTHRQVVESVRLSWMAYQATEAQKDYLQRQVEETRKTKEAYLKQFNIGQRTLLDVLNTENELLDAQRSALNSRFDGEFSHYRLMVGMSKLLETLGVEPPKEANVLN